VPSTIRIKRSSVAGKKPTTSDISTGELALNTKDFKLFSSNGTAIFELANASALANTNSRIGLLNTNLTGTNTALRTLINARLQVSNATTLLAAKASWAGLTSTNTALRTLISDRLQVANAAATYQTRAIERAALANTNSSIATQATRVTLVNTNLTGTNTALRTLINARLQVSNATTLLASKASWAGLTATNTALRTLISDRLQVANASAIYAPKASPTFTGTVSAPVISVTQSSGDEGGQIDLAIAATNTTLTGGVAIDIYQNRLRIFEKGGTNRGAYIDLTAATAGVGSNLLSGGGGGGTITLTKTAIKDLTQNDQVVTNVSSGVYANTVVDNSLLNLRATWAGLTATNTALRTLISDRLQVSNAATLYATKSNPATSGVLAHTGRATISTNLTVSGNTTSGRYILPSTGVSARNNGADGWMFEGTGYVYHNQSGPTYSQTRIIARAGISDDTNQTLTLFGGVNGSTTINGLLAAAGRATIGTNLTVSGNTTLNGTTTDNSNALSQTLTDAATIAWNTASGRVASVTLTASRTMGAPTNLKIGTYILNVIQGGTGSYGITWNSVFKWPAGVAPSLSTAVGARDLFTFYSDGTNLYGSYLPDVK